jgi:hypothetical protein
VTAKKKRALGSRLEVRPAPYYAEIRCVICGRELTVKAASSTSEAIRSLHKMSVLGNWWTMLLPKGMRGHRRVMVCGRCKIQLKPVSVRAPSRTAIRFDTWGPLV